MVAQVVSFCMVELLIRNLEHRLDGVAAGQVEGEVKTRPRISSLQTPSRSPAFPRDPQGSRQIENPTPITAFLTRRGLSHLASKLCCLEEKRAFIKRAVDLLREKRLQDSPAEETCRQRASFDCAPWFMTTRPPNPRPDPPLILPCSLLRSSILDGPGNIGSHVPKHPRETSLNEASMELPIAAQQN